MLYQPLLEYSTPYIVKKTERFTSFPIHIHHEIEIIYCLEGSLSVKLDGIEYRIKANEALFIGSMTPHEYCSVKDGCSILFIEFGSMLLREKFTYLSRIKFDNPILKFSEPETEACKSIHESMQNLVNLISSKCFASDLHIISDLYKLSASIISEYGKQTAVSSAEQNNKYQIEKALELIYVNYQSDVTIEDAAQAAGYSKSNFCRNFKLATGIGFHQYLTKYRITNACYLLQTTSYSIEKISETVGYQDSRSFCRAFKHITGTTPMQYRNVQKNIQKQS